MGPVVLIPKGGRKIFGKKNFMIKGDYFLN